ncbi:hypothetical protein ES703_96130 [subsurface metagenome]
MSQGKLGDITLRRRGKYNIAGKTPVVPDQKTEPQLLWRHMYLKCATLWHSLSKEEKQDWESLARSKQMTGFAYWQSLCLKPNPGIYLPLQGGTMQGAIDMDGFHIHGLPLPIHVQDVWRRQDFQDFCLPYHHTQGARVYHDADQSIPDSVPAILAFNSERYDTDTIHDPVTNNSRLTCKTAGIYAISFCGQWEPSVVGLRTSFIYLNGVTTIAQQADEIGALGFFTASLSTIYQLAVNDFLEVMVLQTSGAALDMQTFGNYTPEFSMQRIG